MTVEPVRASPDWLSLRERADAAARAVDLADEALRRLPDDGTVVVHDLGCGTGSMGRWLAPRLDRAQHWVLYDRDAELLEHAAQQLPRSAAGGAAVTAEVRHRDVSRLPAGDLTDASLITASALLDVMTADELRRCADACTAAGCPVLLTLSVTGRVDLSPSDPLDEAVAAAFNDHQRRTAGHRTLLGPDAVQVAVDAFGRLGADVLVRHSPWRLGPAEAALTAEWFTGWLDAACEQRPELVGLVGAYAAGRLEDAAAGRLTVTVDHVDLLALPRQGSRP